MRGLVLILLLPITSPTWAFNWADLWTTPDHQAQAMMHQGAFSEAEKKFNHPDWQALAAFRAGHYKKAAALYHNLKNNEYNQGNALAYAGQLEAALQAYNKAIANNPHDKDARYNRKIVQALLKKKQEQQKQEQQKQDQQKQDQQKQDQQKQDQQNQDQQNQDQQNQDQQKQDQQNQDQQNQDQQNQDQQKQDQQKQDQQKQDQQKQDQPATPQANKAHQTKTKQDEREQNAAKKQWLKLIPDDPGGLLREKFLRDYLRRQQG